MIKLKSIIKEIEDESIDVDKLFWHQSYLEDIAEKLGYQMDFSKLYWEYLYREPLFHCTQKEYLPLIQQKGLLRKDVSRGITNRNIGPVVFACPEEEIEYFKSYYGPVVLRIDTFSMKKDGYTPNVEKEPDWANAEMLAFVLNNIGNGREREAGEFVDSSDGNTSGTVIFYGSIPPKYLSVVEGI